jgi:hypothetical protein
MISLTVRVDFPELHFEFSWVTVRAEIDFTGDFSIGLMLEMNSSPIGIEVSYYERLLNSSSIFSS